MIGELHIHHSYRVLMCSQSSRPSLQVLYTVVFSHCSSTLSSRHAQGSKRTCAPATSEDRPLFSHAP